MRRFVVAGATGNCSCGQSLRALPTSLPLSSSSWGTAAAPGGHLLSRRAKASFVRVANRRRVEMFLAKRFHLPTRLKTAAPEIAAEWDHERNPMHLYPEIVGVGHMAPVWWKCRACQHSFSMSVEKRVVRGGGCPACATAREKRDDLLDGEQNPDMRPKRPVMFNLRTKY